MSGISIVPLLKGEAFTPRKHLFVERGPHGPGGALGEIRSPDAIPDLTRIVKKKRWMRRQLNDELRIAAAAALGDLADESTRSVLENATHDRTAAVARAAAQGLKQLDKANT